MCMRIDHIRLAKGVLLKGRAAPYGSICGVSNSSSGSGDNCINRVLEAVSGVPQIQIVITTTY